MPPPGCGRYRGQGITPEGARQGGAGVALTPESMLARPRTGAASRAFAQLRSAARLGKGLWRRWRRRQREERAAGRSHRLAAYLFGLSAPLPKVSLTMSALRQVSIVFLSLSAHSAGCSHHGKAVSHAHASLSISCAMHLFVLRPATAGAVPCRCPRSFHCSSHVAAVPRRFSYWRHVPSGQRR